MLAEGHSGLEWLDNVLEFQDGGTTWRIERDAEDATEFAVFQNDTLRMEGELVWDGSEVATIRMLADGAWSEVSADGHFMDTSLGSIGTSCDPYELDPENVWFCIGDPEFAPLFQGCDEEFAAARKSGEDAVAAGLVALVTAKTPVSPITTGIFLWKTSEHLGDLYSYALCRWF